MTSANLIEELEHIQIQRPPSMSDVEFAKLQIALQDARDRLRPYRGVFEADWLLSEFAADRWQTKGLDSACIDDKWVRTKNIDWSVRLSNGDFLTDRKYSDLLSTVKKATFFYRQGFADGSVPTIATWASFVNVMLMFARWLVFSGHFENRLVLLNQHRFDELTVELAIGGWSGVFQLPERIVAALYKEAFQQDCPQTILADPGHIPQEIRHTIIAHLEAIGAYEGSRDRRGVLSRKYLCQILNEPAWAMRGVSNRTRAVTRQFEPRLHDDNGLLISIDESKRYPSHRTITLESALAQPTTFTTAKRFCGSMRVLLSMHRHLSDWIPDPATINTTRSSRLARPHSSPDGHTPMVPIETGLHYLNQAMKWVNQFGDGVVEHFLAVTTYAVGETRETDLSPWELVKVRGRALKNVPLPKSLSEAGFDFGVRHATQGMTGKVTEPENLDFTQAIRVLVGAVAILISIFKPSRESEINRLDRHCLIGNGPYWLEGEIAKSGVQEHRNLSGGKPIPAIAAKGIQQLQRLGGTLVELYGEKDPVHAERLFYLPRRGVATGAFAARTAVLNYYLNSFCDYVDMPLDDLGRRWYLRIHEMRKWFLLLFFWSGRYDVLDAAREIAGHNDVSDLYAYVEREFSSDDFYRLEAEYAVDRLRDYGYTKETHPGEQGLVALYNKVLEQFDVEQLELISDRSWEPYVIALRQQGEFHLEPHSVSDENGNSRICISFLSRRKIELDL